MLGAVAVLLFAVQAVRAETAQADVCVPNVGHYLCSWEAYLSPYQTRFFQAPGGHNLRNWIKGGVGDQYNGTVAAKCIYIRQGSGPAAISVACGNGYPSNPVPSNYNPGYLYIFHYANGARTITGAGLSP